MKEVSCFQARFNIVKLYRKSVYDFDIHKSMSNSQTMLVMDYYDTLEVDEFHADTEEFSKFMGLSIYEDFTENDITMQSIPLYCPEITGKMVEEYCCHNNFFRDPFNKESRKYRYFSMIQVDISPEILVRLDQEHMKKTKKQNSEYLNMYNAFFKDLHILMADFVSKRFREDEEEACCYRVYQSMSACDFVVVVRCNNPEVPFEVDSMLRRRKIELKRPVKCRGTKELYKNFFFYKTYTLMSLDNSIIQSTSHSEDASDMYDIDERCFLLCCVLSNKYWSYEEDIIRNINSEDYVNISSFMRFNGQHSFTVTLSEQAFLYINPILDRYKTGSSQSDSSYGSTIVPTDPDEKKICGYIESLMKEKFISYVSVTFLFKDKRPGIEAENYNNDIRVIEPDDGFLFANEIIAQKLSVISKRIKMTYQRILRIDTSRRSLLYNMHLLERIVSMCNAINGISDYSIYCSITINKIEIALDGINYYLSLLGMYDVEYDSKRELSSINKLDVESFQECSDKEYDEIVEALDFELMETMQYINSFVKTILDSSLQSLQKPYFILETHTSVEKLCMCYSYFLNRFFNWFGETELNKTIYGIQSDLYTLMVPQSMVKSLTTKVLFNWRKDDTLKRRLLVILYPSFSNLTDFSTSIGILIKEIAYFLRYESRGSRNAMILRYSSDLLFDQVSMNFFSDLCKNIPRLNNYYDYTEQFRICLANAYSKYIGLKEKNVSDLSIYNLIGVIEDRYKAFVYAVDYLSNLRRYIKEFISDYNIRNNEEYRLVLDDLDLLYHLFFSEMLLSCSKDEVFAVYDRVLNSLNEIPIEKMLINELEDSNRIILKLYDHLINFNQSSEELIDEKDFLELCINTAKYEWELDAKVRELLVGHSNNANSKKIARYLQIGIYAGLDGREKGFINFAESYVLTSMPSSLMLMNSMIDIYRDVTSDLFMVKILGLTSYGYLNFFTRNVSIDDILAETYAKRVCMVLYAIESEKSGGSEIDWNQVWIELYKSVCSHCLSVVRKYEENGHSNILSGEISVEGRTERCAVSDYFNMLGDKIYSCINETEQEMIINNLCTISVAAVAIQASLNFNNDKDNKKAREKFLIELLHCRYLCTNLSSLIYEYRVQLQSVYSFDYLAKDFFDGAKTLNKLHNEFTKSRMWKYCSYVSELFNEDVSCQVDCWEQNRIMTEFVMDMNYSMLFSNAFEMPIQFADK